MATLYVYPETYNFGQGVKHRIFCVCRGTTYVDDTDALRVVNDTYVAKGCVCSKCNRLLVFRRVPRPSSSGVLGDGDEYHLDSCNSVRSTSTSTMASFCPICGFDDEVPTSESDPRCSSCRADVNGFWCLRRPMTIRELNIYVASLKSEPLDVRRDAYPAIEARCTALVSARDLRLQLKSYRQTLALD